MEKRYGTATIICFLLLIFGFFAANAAVPDKTFSDNENAALTAFPDITAQTLKSGKFMEDFGEYANDQFVLRDLFIAAKAELERLSGKKENNGVLFAGDGYLIKKAEPFGRASRLNIEAIEQMQALGRYNISVLVAPTAAEIEKGLLPAFAYTDGERQLIDALSYSAAECGYYFCDAGGEIEVLKGQRYYRTDHHWTSDAAFAAYCALMRGMGREVPQRDDFEITELSDGFYGTTWSRAMLFGARPDAVLAYIPKGVEIKVVSDGEHGELIDGEYLEKKDKYAAFLGGNHAVCEIESSIKDGGTAVVFKDSYANCMAPMLAASYSRVVFVDLRYYNQDPLELADGYGADDVIFICNAGTFNSERNIAKIGAFIE